MQGGTRYSIFDKTGLHRWRLLRAKQRRSRDALKKNCAPIITCSRSRVWGKSWADVFAADVTEEFTPNDFEIRPPDWFTARRLRRAIRK